MNRTIRTVHEASNEFAEAVRWYEEQRQGLGAEFYESVVETTARIQDNPACGPPVSKDERTRRLLVSRFPYQVVYRLREDEIVIVAVAHVKRRPKYWRGRT